MGDIMSYLERKHRKHRKKSRESSVGPLVAVIGKVAADTVREESKKAKKALYAKTKVEKESKYVNDIKAETKVANKSKSVKDIKAETKVANKSKSVVVTKDSSLIDRRIDAWKKRLLDLGKRNRLINFKETKRSNLKINNPDYKDLFNAIVEKEKSLTFSFPLKTVYDENGDEQNISIQKGDLETDRPLEEQQKTLKSLRAKAKTSIEEQGINSLYLTFGMIMWKDFEKSDQWITSPIILVPVILIIESIKDPFVLQLHEDEIVVNPSLAFKFENDFGITLPEYDPETGIEDYLLEFKKIAHKNDWEINTDVNLTLLSFLKINMYKDLDENIDKLNSNGIVKALAGDKSDVTQIPSELNGYDHDSNERPKELFQVVDADSSQQDAVLLAKNGISFVLQGPPGTGKSQTITNIIAESMAEGKKILFVSEKAAALEVVKNRLTQVGLENFCLNLHSHKANKKEILGELNKTLNIERIKLHDNALYKLNELEQKRNRLTDYSNQLHTICEPLNISLFTAAGQLSKLSNTQDIIFDINNIENVDRDLLDKYKYSLSELSKTIGKLSEDYAGNPWYGCIVPSVTHELRHDIEVTLGKLYMELKDLIGFWESLKNTTESDLNPNVENISKILKATHFSSEVPDFPEQWLQSEIPELKKIADKYLVDFNERTNNVKNILSKYKSDIFKLNAKLLLKNIEVDLVAVQANLNKMNFRDYEKIISRSDHIISESNTLKENIDEVNSEISRISSYLEIGRYDSFESVNKLIEIIGLILKASESKAEWFSNSTIEKNKTLLNEAQEKKRSHENDLNLIKILFEDKIFGDGISEDVSNLKRESILYKTIGFSKNIEKSQIKVNDVYSFVDNEVETLKKYWHKVEQAVENFKVLKDKIALDMPKTLDEIYLLKEILSEVIKNPKPTRLWFDSNKETMVEKVITDIKRNIDQIEEEKTNLFVDFHKEILDVDCKAMITRFNTEYSSFLRILKKQYRQDKKDIIAHQKLNNNKMKDDEIKIVLNKIASINEKKQWLEENFKLANEVLGDLYSDVYTNWDMIKKNRENFKLIKNYFGTISSELEDLLVSSDLSSIAPNISTICELQDEELEFIKKILDSKVTKISLKEMEKCLNYLFDDSSENRKSLDLLHDCVSSEGKFNKMNFSEVILLLNQLENVKGIENWFLENGNSLESNFGKYYLGLETDWDELRTKIDSVSKIIRFFKKSKVPNKLIRYVSNENDLGEKLTKLQENLNNTRDNLAYRAKELLSKDLHKITFKKLSEALETVNCLVNDISDSYKSVKKCSNKKVLLVNLIKDIKMLDSIQSFDKKLECESDELSEKFNYKYKKLETNWQEILDLLKDVEELNLLKINFGFSDEFLHKIASDADFKSELNSLCTSFEDRMNEFSASFNWYLNLFDDKNEFTYVSLYKLLDRLEKSLSDLTLLEEWIDFRSIREECKQIGLGEFIEKVEELKIPAEAILNTFLKRFYRLWMDSKIVDYPAVNNFRCRTHESLIKDFRNLDIAQFTIARGRIKERLIAKLPDSNYATSSYDEVGILKRELAKQRKIMPLRVLFARIPNLLMTLKPCMMMSPLSVSLYLKADGYDFDLVIFDEASQVFTEDAIGAIMRGKQVVIAGDSKQLPPTSFFSSTISDGDDFDIENEDELDDIGAFDSVLEEAANALPERTLKWHYRSRHEHLIAFSNVKIYDNKLITFPSNLERMSDNGVEYIYVNNGVYDRGGKKNNLNEAMHVAKLVFEHFKTNPKRSLGVIAFSESQKLAIDNALEKLRLENIEFERFFNESNEQAFFTKNIETVQGDERDTIIFSIGYAKDQNGQMYMNFGPLTKNGGHRRLNVAITRAKYNVKLVGSIQPTDIRLEKTNSEGAILLRRYIEFAMNGDSVLRNELQVNDDVALESPFEESVYDFLINHGFNVKTQVGCSGYRIDLAIKHPTLDGVFVLGIECDGAAYHSARTARERDRLRQTILEDIGWKIYRIWSTDWIKDTSAEGEKLLSAVRNAIEQHPLNNISNDIVEVKSVEIENDFIEVVSKDTQLSGNRIDDKSANPYGFENYIETQISDVERTSDQTKYVSEVIEYVVNKEHPIHFELLCKRIAPLYGNQKATVKVRFNANHVLRLHLADKVKVIDGFCFDLKAEEIRVRIPNDGEGRPINYICTEEISMAMIKIVENSFGLEKNSLFTLTARTFGFNRTGANVISAMEQACDYLLETKKVREVDGKIII